MISTHILDTSKGQPAEGVKVLLEKWIGQDWKGLGDGTTNSDGRTNFECPKEKGLYRLSFEVPDYFQREKRECFFGTIPVVFRIENVERKYHVPLLLNPYGYSTYRGS